MCFSDPACSLHSNNSGRWLQANLGAFSVLVTLNDIHMLYSNFSAVCYVVLFFVCLGVDDQCCLNLACVFFCMQMEALPQLTVRQLAELSITPGQLTTPEQVTMVMNNVPNELLAYFYDNFSPAIIVRIHHTSQTLHITSFT